MKQDFSHLSVGQSVVIPFNRGTYGLGKVAELRIDSVVIHTTQVFDKHASSFTDYAGNYEIRSNYPYTILTAQEFEQKDLK